MGAMEVETKFLRLFKPVALGDRIDGWRVCWIGGWDKCRVLFVVVVERPRRTRCRPLGMLAQHSSGSAALWADIGRQWFPPASAQYLRCL
jgi:hypothetical protein